MIDYAPPSSYQFPTRPAPVPRSSTVPINTQLIPQNPYGPPPPTSSHSRTRTASSGVFPAPSNYDVYYGGGGVSQPYHQSYYPMSKQRTDSSSTGTTARSNTISMPLGRSASTNTASSISAPASSNYVAALRRQKATVWCDKSQQEDPRLQAAQRTAKLKAAAADAVGSSSAGIKGSHGGSGSSSSTSLRANVRSHHKLGKSATMNSTVGIGTNSLVNRPPTPRLSATEANDDSSGDDDLYMVGTHRRSGSGSGRSSLNSNHRTYTGSRRTSVGGAQCTTSRGSSEYSPNMFSTELSESQQPRGGKSRTPPSLASPHILEETSPDMRISNSYFEATKDKGGVKRSGSALRRSGSVDEGEVARTMTMSGLRLVVANPD